MENNKFTPGPWEASINKDCLAEHDVSNGSTQMCIASVHVFDADEQTIANARLIAAAPDMYAALVEVIKFHERGCSRNAPVLSPHWEGVVRAALAKANGR